MAKKNELKGNYKYADNVPTHLVTGYMKSEESELLVFQTKMVKGLTPFGPQAGVLEESDLTDSIIEYLLNKEDAEGNKIYADYLVKL